MGFIYEKPGLFSRGIEQRGRMRIEKAFSQIHFAMNRNKGLGKGGFSVNIRGDKVVVYSII